MAERIPKEQMDALMGDKNDPSPDQARGEALNKLEEELKGRGDGTSGSPPSVEGAFLKESETHTKDPKGREIRKKQRKRMEGGHAVPVSYKQQQPQRQQERTHTEEDGGAREQAGSAEAGDDKVIEEFLDIILPIPDKEIPERQLSERDEFQMRYELRKEKLERNPKFQSLSEDLQQKTLSILKKRVYEEMQEGSFTRPVAERPEGLETIARKIARREQLSDREVEIYRENTKRVTELRERMQERRDADDNRKKPKPEAAPDVSNEDTETTPDATPDTSEDDVETTPEDTVGPQEGGDAEADSDEFEEAMEDFSPEEQERIRWNLENFGYKLEEVKSETFSSGFGWVADKFEGGGTLNRFFGSLKDQFGRKAQSARSSMEDIRKQQERGSGFLKSNIKNLGSFARNAIRYGRVITDAVGWTAATPIRSIMLASMAAASGFEAGKEARFKSDEYRSENLRINDIDKAAEEAWAVYEKAQKNAEGELEKEDLQNAYREYIPEDLLKRLADRPMPMTGSNIVQKIFEGHITSSAKRWKKKLEEIDNSDLSREEKVKKKQAYLSNFGRSKTFRDYDRMITQTGSIDTLALLARSGEKISKGVMYAMMLDTLYRVWDGLGELLSEDPEEMIEASNEMTQNDFKNLYGDSYDEIFGDASEEAAGATTAPLPGMDEPPVPAGAAGVETLAEAGGISEGQIQAAIEAGQTHGVEAGGSLWESGRSLVDDGAISNDQFWAAWNNPDSLVEVDGEMQHISDVDLVHEGDRLVFVEGEDGQPPRFTAVNESGYGMGTELSGAEDVSSGASGETGHESMEAQSGESVSDTQEVPAADRSGAIPDDYRAPHDVERYGAGEGEIESPVGEEVVAASDRELEIQRMPEILQEEYSRTWLTDAFLNDEVLSSRRIDGLAPKVSRFILPEGASEESVAAFAREIIDDITTINEHELLSGDDKVSQLRTLAREHPDKFKSLKHMVDYWTRDGSYYVTEASDKEIFKAISSYVDTIAKQERVPLDIRVPQAVEGMPTEHVPESAPDVPDEVEYNFETGEWETSGEGGDSVSGSEDGAGESSSATQQKNTDTPSSQPDTRVDFEESQSGDSGSDAESTTKDTSAHSEEGVQEVETAEADYPDSPQEESSPEVKTDTQAESVDIDVDLENVTSAGRWSGRILDEMRREIPQIQTAEDADWFLRDHYGDFIQEFYFDGDIFERGNSDDFKYVAQNAIEMKSIISKLDHQYDISGAEKMHSQLDDVIEKSLDRSSFAYQKRREILDKARDVVRNWDY